MTSRSTWVGVRFYAAPGESPDIAEALGTEVPTVEVDHLSQVRPGDAAAVLLLSGALAESGSGSDLLSLPAHVVVVATDLRGRRLAESADRLFLSAEELAGERGLQRGLQAAAEHALECLALERQRTLAEASSQQLRELNRVGMALMSERDPERLLGLILTQARRLSQSDAGSLYLVEDSGEGPPRLHFLRAQNDTLPHLPSPDFTLPLDRSSIAGYVASTRETLVIDDVYHLPTDAPYSFNPSFDREHGYRARSMLVVPMLDHRDRIVGVLQLINRKSHADASIQSEADADRWVLPFTGREEEFVRSLAGQAAVSIENGQLYAAIEGLFEGFIKAAVTAIDQRDPTTSGHSVRVTEMTCALAEVVDETREGPYADVRFSRDEMKQLRYAGLLHDFGKVGVREWILTKQKKLPSELLARVTARFPRIRTVLRARHHRALAELALEAGTDAARARQGELQAELERELDRVDRYEEAILDANEPRVLAEDGAAILQEILEASVEDLDGTPIAFLTDDEYHYLQIKRGSLDADEVKQIQDHVVHSWNFLQEIPWTDELQEIDDIVRGHHEKLDGTGYPDGIGGEKIRLETRMMTVADIFDALTASDRPYKKAMPVDRALSILQAEAEGGQLDPELVRLFVESKVYERVLNTNWREL